MVFHGRGIVWDPKNDKRLMKFVDGKYETNDKRIIDVLLRAGYPHDEEPVIDEPIEKEPVKKRPVKKRVSE
jgi:hypothetical protein